MGTRRIDLPDIPYHIYARGNNKEPIFFDERDRLTYLKILREAKEKFAFLLYSYALMDNHFHLLLLMQGISRLSQLMHHVQLFYAKYFNRKYGRVGHVFQSRYHSIPVDTDRYFLIVDRYIHLNAVRAGMVQKPEDFPWSSYRDRFSKSPCEWIAHAEVLDYFGKELTKQLKDYRLFTEEAIGSPEEWPDATLRKMTYIGSEKFAQQIRMAQAAQQHAQPVLIP